MSIGSTTAESGGARFSRQVAWTLATRILAAGSALLAGVIIARLLGAESVGVLASLTVAAALIATFGSFGMTSAITFLVARDRRYLKAIVFNAALFSLAAGAILAAILVAIAY